MARSRSPWGREYQRRREYVWGTEPTTFARRVADLLPGGRVLDLGCGEGRDAVFFASRGFAVTGVDVSAAGIGKARRLARAAGVRVRWVVADLGRFVPRASYDLVYSCGAVHYVPRRLRVRLFPRWQAITRPGGLHAHIVFTDREIYVEKGEVVDYFQPGELRNYYGDWEVLEYGESSIACCQDGTPHRHSVARLVARRVPG